MKITKTKLKQIIKEELEEGIAGDSYEALVGGIGGGLQRVSQAVKGATKPTLGLQTDPKNAKVAAKNISHEITRYLKVEGSMYIVDVLIDAVEEAEKSLAMHRKRGRGRVDFRSELYGLGGILQALQELKGKQEG